MDEGLTIAGLVALVTMNLAIVGIVVSQMRRSSDLRERVARLEQRLNNGQR